MALSTTQYGYIIDPMVPFTDDKGKTIKNGFVRVFVAGSSTPVVTYRNFDGATNQDRIELDNSGRTKTSVIGSKGFTYKVCVYDKHHSQESPILTVDKVSVIGANITAGAGATVVTGLDGLTTKPDGFVDASVVGTDGYVALDHTLVTDDLDTDAKVTAVEDDRYVPLLNEDVNDPDSKMTLGRLWQWVLGKIKNLSTTITAFRTGDVIPVDGPSGTAKMSKDDLLKETAENALGSIHSLSDTATEADIVAGNYLALDGSAGTKKLPAEDVAKRSVQDYTSMLCKLLGGEIYGITSVAHHVTQVMMPDWDGASFVLSNTGSDEVTVYFMSAYSKNPADIIRTINILAGENYSFTISSDEGLKQLNFNSQSNYSVNFELINNVVESSQLIADTQAKLQCACLFHEEFSKSGGTTHVSVKYIPGIAYKVSNTSQETINVYYMKKESSLPSDVVFSATLAAGESCEYTMGATPIVQINVACSNPYTFSVDSANSVKSLYDMFKLVTKDTLSIFGKGVSISGSQVPKTEHIEIDLSYKGLSYKVENNGNSAVTVYFMKSRTSSVSDVLLSTTINAGESCAYEIGDFPLMRINVACNATYSFVVSLSSSLSGIQKITGLGTFAIIGDSYSTYQNYLLEDEAVSYYRDGYVLTSVKDTWWFKMAKRLGMSMLKNDSWSGSTISNSVHETMPLSSSMVNRVVANFGQARVSEPKANVIFFFGGTNDSTRGLPMGSVKYSGWTESDLLETLPALCYCIDTIIKWNPGSKIIFILNSGLSSTFNDGVNEACAHYGVPVVRLHDINKTSNHPTAGGMTSICEQVCSFVLAGANIPA